MIHPAQTASPTRGPLEPAAGAPAQVSSAEALGVYVHFPWCLSKCPYCDFVAFGTPRSAIDGAAYADAVLTELAARKQELEARSIESIFFGGGTPSLWGAGEVRRVIEAIVRSFSSDAALEVSLECDPSSLDEDTARALVAAGVGRLSIGVQALDDDRLRFLGRIHTREEAIAAVRAAVRAGVPRVSTDLMYAVAGQRPEDAATEATALAELGATHVSAYSLTIEQGTPFGQLARRGRLPLCDDAIMAESFFAIDDALTRAGFAHYEVSNYAKPGNEARHNLGYWRGRDYLGIGCGAYGTLRTTGGALRYRNHATPRAYLEAARAAGREAHPATEGGRDAPGAVDSPFEGSNERLDPATLLRERIMLGLRMKDGFDLEAAARDVGAEPYPNDRRAALARLEERGRIVRHGARIAVPRAAWIWVDDTAAALF